MSIRTHIQPFFDPKTWTVSYVVNDLATKKTAVIDPVMDFDFKSGHTDIEAVDAVLAYLKAEGLTVHALPRETRVFVCHDYPPKGREARWETTIAELKAGNIHVRDGISEEEFVAMRNARDATLEVPTLVLPSIQVNIRAAQLPPADENGVAYLRIPLNVLPTRK